MVNDNYDEEVRKCYRGYKDCSLSQTCQHGRFEFADQKSAIESVLTEILCFDLLPMNTGFWKGEFRISEQLFDHLINLEQNDKFLFRKILETEVHRGQKARAFEPCLQLRGSLLWKLEPPLKNP